MSRRRKEILREPRAARKPASYVCDMDGVLYRGDHLLPGAAEFVARLRRGRHKFVFLTNNAERTPRELQRKLARLGIRAEVEHFFTAALATAAFLDSQRPRGSAFVIGGNGLVQALKSVGYRFTEETPDYVVVGTSEEYDYDKLCKAVRFVSQGSRLIGANPDLTGPTEMGLVPACGSLIAPIQLATKTFPYFIGKPNSLMMRMALRYLGSHSGETFMVGDNMDTDIVGGIEAGMQTILVLSGVARREDLRRYGYQPKHVFDNVGEIPVERLSGEEIRS